MALRPFQNGNAIQMQTLTTSLRHIPTERHAQFNLLKSLLGLACSETDLKRIDLTPFFNFYHEWCDFALTDGGRYISCQTHEGVLAIAKAIREGYTREQIYDRLKAAYVANAGQPVSEYEAINGSIDLAAGLLLMTVVGKPRFGSLGHDEIEWKTGDLKSSIGSWFEDQKTQTEEYVRLERSFNALSLEMIAGVKIEWTYNLVDHLRLLDADDSTRHESVVLVFHCASFLHLQKYREHPILSTPLIEETLRTIALLLPREDEAVKSWYLKELKLHNLDLSAIKLPYLKREQRRIENFVFWRERLIILKQYFDETEPKDIRQWWYDRRKRVQWYTFWVAVVVLALTLFFGLVQSIEGALQVYKAYHPS